MEYEPMAAKAIQEQIHKGFEYENHVFMKGAQNSGIWGQTLTHIPLVCLPSLTY